jgi:acyl carrier protein phosphodiesterase
MNFLAHIYLSGNDDLIKIGNFMADGIKGKDYEEYPEKLKKGILLHRFIDTYTDAHPIVRESTKRLHSKYHHYSGVAVDMFYDHFLAKNWSRYSDEPLDEFVQQFYASLQANYDVLTDKTKHLLPYMVEHNWLWNYQYLEGLEDILKQMDYRTRYKSKLSFSVNELKQDYEAFESEFFAFFEALRTASAQKLEELLQTP